MASSDRPPTVSAFLIAGHAPFAWGKTAYEAAHNAVVLEALARMAYRTLSLKANADEVSQVLLDRHYFRSRTESHIRPKLAKPHPRQTSVILRDSRRKPEAIVRDEQRPTGSCFYRASDTIPAALILRKSTLGCAR